MLQAWRDFVETVDPDVVIGYNIGNFDFPYLMDRAKALKAARFPYLGRMKGSHIFSNLHVSSELTNFASRVQNRNQEHPFLVQSLWSA